jgi:AcrR family transcriptional regulator
MNDIARCAGVSKGTLYVYFSSKEQLFEALIREERRQQAEQVCTLAFESGMPRDVLMKFGCNLMELKSRPETLAHIRTVIAISGKFPQLGRAFFEAGPQYGAIKLAAYLAEQTRLGALRVPDPQQAAWQFLDLCQAGNYQPLIFGMIDHLDAADIEAGVKAAVDTFMAAFGPTAT